MRRSQTADRAELTIGAMSTSFVTTVAVAAPT